MRCLSQRIVVLNDSHLLSGSVLRAGSMTVFNDSFIPSGSALKNARVLRAGITTALELRGSKFQHARLMYFSGHSLIVNTNH